LSNFKEEIIQISLRNLIAWNTPKNTYYKMGKQDYERDWDSLPIKYLILSLKGKYIVFIDHENDLDWKTSDEYDKIHLAPEVIKEFNIIKNEIDSTENIPCDHLDEKVIIKFKRQVGEALVRSLESDFTSAKTMIKIARDFIINRNLEHSRQLYLIASGVTSTFFILIGIILWLYRDSCIQHLTTTVFYLALSFIAGSLGAFLSIILRMGNTVIDYNATPMLHYLEAVSRIFAGMISALLIALCIKTGVLLPVFNKIQSTNLAMLLGGLIAGASERFAPSIISKLNGNK